jgi:hypothetical protein
MFLSLALLTERKGDMATEYSEAPEVEKVAEKIVKEFHPHLHGVRIDYVFVSKTDKEGMPQPILSKGKHVHGKAKKISGLNAYLASKYETPDDEEFFVIEISHYSWSYFSPDQRVALVDHELTHCALGAETGTPEIRSHDVEEFTEIVKRRGLWEPDLEQFAQVAAKKLPLFEGPGFDTATLSRVEDDGTETPIVSINTDKKCSRCKRKGASQNGMCLTCTTKALNAGEFDDAIKTSAGVAQAVGKMHRATKGQ